ncbi:hypothetical protein CRUP_019883 [Coryphaenoides rupestris]|nr:hypothetical protein CRUP_019883 [Coryphaenoides rupestris]
MSGAQVRGSMLALSLISLELESCCSDWLVLSIDLLSKAQVMEETLPPAVGRRPNTPPPSPALPFLFYLPSSIPPTCTPSPPSTEPPKI